MLYNTGTIAINGNTATGTGTNWTAPASQVRAGQTIIVMSNPVQLFQISSVNSATSMTVTPAASPALSGQKYAILVSDIISVDGLAQAMSQLIKEYDENIGAWETFATTSANQTITVTINGTTVTIPGIGKLAQKGSNGALAVADGGTGATTAADARTNLGLGTAALLDGSYLAMTNKENTFSDNLAVRKSASYASFSLTSLSNNEDAVGSTNLIEMDGGAPGATPLFYIARRNRINSVGQWIIHFPAAGGTLALAGTSDINFKCDIEEFDGQESVEKILALELRKFKYIDDEKRRVRRGIIAQQAELVEPLYVKHTREPDGTEEFDEEGNKITQGYRERLVLDNNAIILDLLCALQVAMKTIHRHEERLASLEQAMKAFTTSGSGK
ncbi:tail fiber domain-containing protein [Escherichia coli]